MRPIVKTSAAVLVLGLATRVAGAENTTADVSLEKEVAQYIQYTTAAAEEDPHAFEGKWSSGLKWTSADKAFEFKVRGRFFLDNYFISSDEYAETPDVTFWRAIRLGAEGKMYENIKYVVEFDFAGAAEGTEDDEEVEFKDVYFSVGSVPALGTVALGHFYEPFGLEQQTSSRHVTFMERSAATNAFSPQRNVGAAMFRTFDVGEVEERIYLGLGVFRETDDGGRVARDGGYNGSLRVSGVVLENEENHTLLHLGFDASLRDPNGKEARFRARPDTGEGVRLVDTGAFDCDRYAVFAFEAAFNWESLSVQGEYMMADCDGLAAGDPSPTFSGWYIQASYWITGEHRPYKKSKGAFDRVKPKRNFHAGDKGWGAVEVAVRYAALDLNDAGVTGGEMDTLLFGVNWHWNPNMRWMFDFGRADIDSGPSGPGKLTFFATRFQFDF